MSAVQIALTVLLTVYGQLALKWHMNRAGEMPTETFAVVIFLCKQLFSPLVISSFASAFLGGLTWMAAISRMQLSIAYPFMSLSFPLVSLLSVLLFGEQFTQLKFAGTAFILLGLFLLSR